MFRAQGIAKRYQVEKEKDSKRLRTLEYILDYEYKKYLDLCFWCYEKPVNKGEWLRQEINTYDK